MTASKETAKKKKPKDAQDEDQFVDPNPPQRNWKGIAISLLVIVVVCSLITMSVVVLTPAEVPDNRKSRLTVEDLFKAEFIAHDPEAKWINDSAVTYRNRDGDVVKFDFVSNRSEVLLGNSTFVAFKVAKYSLSPDLKYALFAYDVKQVYRHSYTASYILYDLDTREVLELNPPEVQDAVLQHAAWGRRGQQLVYIFENNIYYQPDVRSKSLRITSSGMEGVIFNGMADWLYEEEILNSHLAHWWSPDGDKLAYLAINDSRVPNMALPQFTGSTYPKGLQYPYPMAGQTNPVVRLTVVSLFGATHSQDLLPPHHFTSSDFYIVMVQWASSSHLAVRWLNRSQNASVLTLCDSTTGACVQRYEQSSDAWLSKQNQSPVFSRDGSRFFLTVPVRQGGQGDFHHIAMINKKNEVRHLTSGDWEVTQIISYDESSHLLYFMSTENSPQQRHLYSVLTLGQFPRQCVTCLLRDECTFYRTEVSAGGEHALLHCEGPGVPAVLLVNLNDLSSYFILEDNLPMRSALESKRTLQSHTVTITTEEHFGQVFPLTLRLPDDDDESELNEHNGELNTRTNHLLFLSYLDDLPLKLTYPADFSDSRRYALLLLIGSTPGGQTVSEQCMLGWDWVLVDSEEIIVARLDSRGSGFRGERLLHQLHHRLGTVDVQDQIAALQYLVKLPYIDRSRIGVYGQGYGGYVSLMMMRSAEWLIRCVAAQAPVIDWTLYASAFSERYLGSPAGGSKANRYQTSKVLAGLEGLNGEPLFLAHGTADANVHFQHSAELIRHLIKTGANYTMQIYPDEGHFLSAHSRLQLSHSLVGYFRGCLLDSSSILNQPDD